MLWSNATAYTIAGAYFTYFAVISLQYTYLPSYLLTHDRFTGGQIFGFLFAGVTLVGIVAQPLWGQIADYTRKTGTIIRYCALVTAIAFVALSYCHDLWAVAFCLWPAGFCMAAIPSLLDTVALTRFGVKRYGTIRVWGSIGYGSTAFLFPVIGQTLSAHAPLQLVIPSLMLCATFMAAITIMIGEEQRSREGPKRKVSILELLRIPGFAVFLLFAALHWCAHTPYNFLDVHRASTGLPIKTTGMAVGLGIICEITAMLTASKWLHLTSPRRWLMIVAAITALRWAIMTSPLGNLAFILLQTLQGISFGVFLPVCIAFLTTVVPDEMRATGQTMFSMITFSVGTVLGNFVIGVGIELAGKSFYVFAAAAIISILALVSSLWLPTNKLSAANAAKS